MVLTGLKREGSKGVALQRVVFRCWWLPCSYVYCSRGGLISERVRWGTPPNPPVRVRERDKERRLMDGRLLMQVLVGVWCCHAATCTAASWRRGVCGGGRC